GYSELDRRVALNQGDEIGYVLFSRLGRKSSEIRITMGIDQADIDPTGKKRLIEIPPGCPVERVYSYGTDLLDRSKVDFGFKICEIIFSRVNLFQQICLLSFLKGDFPIADLSQHIIGASLYVLCRFGEGGPAPGRRELYSVIFGRIVTRGEIDTSRSLSAQYLESHYRGWCISLAEKALYPRSGKNTGRLPGKRVTHETGVIAYYDPTLLPGGIQMVRNCLGDDLDILKDEILAENPPPPGCTKSDARHDTSRYK